MSVDNLRALMAMAAGNKELKHRLETAASVEEIVEIANQNGLVLGAADLAAAQAPGLGAVALDDADLDRVVGAGENDGEPTEVPSKFTPPFAPLDSIKVCMIVEEIPAPGDEPKEPEKKPDPKEPKEPEDKKFF